ncbi:hypothetical protein ACFLUY_02565 [Chloroflexota bacterium]
MLRKNYVSKVVPVLKQGDEFIRNPSVITDKWVEDGQIVYGEPVTGEKAQEARNIVRSVPQVLTLLDNEVNKILWTFTNLFPGCIMKSVAGIRQKKKFFWDLSKNDHRYWLATNMAGEAFLGFTAFNTKRITGTDVIDFIKFRQMEAEGHPLDAELFEAVLGKPQQ